MDTPGILGSDGMTGEMMIYNEFQDDLIKKNGLIHVLEFKLRIYV